MWQDTTTVELSALLDSSRAAAAFRTDVLAYAAGAMARPSDRILVARPAPRVKVLRVLAQLLHAEPELAISRVEIDAASGCCDYRGTLVAHADATVHAWRFRWDCRWRAQQAGLLDEWGSPDQGRAAREFTWRCFERWEPLELRSRDGSALEQGA